MSRNVAVLMGGWSSEREVSLVSGAAVADALRAAGYRVTAIDAQRDLGTVLSRLSPRPDVVFNLVESLGGSDRMMAAATLLLESTSLPFTGSGTLAIAMLTDVYVMPRYLTDSVRTPPVRCCSSIAAAMNSSSG